MTEEVNPINSWVELSERLGVYARAASTFGGMNDLDRALYMAIEGINLLIERVPGCDFLAARPKPKLVVIEENEPSWAQLSELLGRDFSVADVLDAMEQRKPK